MATYNIIDIGRQYLFGAAAFSRAHPSSWLIYDPPQSNAEPPDSLSALTVMTPAVSHGGLDPKATHQPVAMEIVKANKPNLFPLGITVGRTENNDVVLKDEQISRFHA